MLAQTHRKILKGFLRRLRRALPRQYLAADGQPIAALAIQIKQSDRAQITRKQPLASLCSTDHGNLAQVGEVALQQIVGQIGFAAQQFLAMQSAALAMRREQLADHAQQTSEFLVDGDAVFGVTVIEGRQRGRNRCAKQYDDPRQIQPEEKDRHNRQRAINLLIVGHIAGIPGKTVLCRFKQHGGNQAADQRIAETHEAIRNHRVGRAQGDPDDQERQR